MSYFLLLYLIVKRLFLILFLAFILNFIWELLHLRFYAYAYIQNAPISVWMVLLSTFGDVVFALLIVILYAKIKYLRKNLWLILIIGIITAMIVEKIGLASGLWAYNNQMPIVPFIETGLSPTIQLGVLTYLIFKYPAWRFSRWFG